MFLTIFWFVSVLLAAFAGYTAKPSILRARLAIKQDEINQLREELDRERLIGLEMHNRLANAKSQLIGITRPSRSITPTDLQHGERQEDEDKRVVPLDRGDA